MSLRLLLVAILIATITPSNAQSPETCVAYMEADAEYRAAIGPYSTAIAAARGRAEKSRDAATRAAFDTRDAALAALPEKPPGCPRDRTYNESCEPWWLVRDKILATHSAALDAVPEVSDDPEYRAIVAERETVAADARKIALEKIRDAYEGPTSNIEEVMWNLISADINRCHAQGFRSGG
ncbi:MAG: hypothetical protein OYH76_22700 [Defluviicoccus sp.]|nr:hypothetical protein [Defluviicoccus sp.]MDE0278715.1 hypothetical protein [Defluviicoccus sp.]